MLNILTANHWLPVLHKDQILDCTIAARSNFVYLLKVMSFVHCLHLKSLISSLLFHLGIDIRKHILGVISSNFRMP